MYDFIYIIAKNTPIKVLSDIEILLLFILSFDFL